MRKKATDANGRELLAAFRSCGWLVLDLSGVGKGCPDVLVYRHGVYKLVEIKTAKGKLNARQQEFQAHGWPVTVIRSVDEVGQLR